MASFRHADARRRDRRPQPTVLQLDRTGTVRPRSRLCRSSPTAAAQAPADARCNGDLRRLASPRPRRALVTARSCPFAETHIQYMVECLPISCLHLQAGSRFILSIVVACSPCGGHGRTAIGKSFRRWLAKWAKLVAPSPRSPHGSQSVAAYDVSLTILWSAVFDAARREAAAMRQQH